MNLFGKKDCKTRCPVLDCMVEQEMNKARLMMSHTKNTYDQPIRWKVDAIEDLQKIQSKKIEGISDKVNRMETDVSALETMINCCRPSLMGSVFARVDTVERRESNLRETIRLQENLIKKLSERIDKLEKNCNINITITQEHSDNAKVEVAKHD